MVAVNPEDYRGRRTLILGDVNTGKTRLTRSILEAFAAAGEAQEIALLDLAPEPAGDVGGKFPASAAGVLHLTTAIVPPRLTGTDEAEVARLAAANADRIEALFDSYLKQPRPILFVNDATLYLQAGSLERFAGLLAGAATAVVNAYQGRHFADGPLTRRERRLTDALARRCDRVIRIGEWIEPWP